jgi:protein-tyrosine phosphatase
VIDLHCHLLPEVDDGARDLAESVALCRLAAAEGCTDLVATPHRRRDPWPDLGAAELERRLAEVESAAGGSPRLHLGGEVRVDSDLLRDLGRDDRGGVLPLAGSRYLLLELEPAGIGPDPVELVATLAAAGWRAIIAHPELTPCLVRDAEQIERLAAAGALFQVTAASVTGELGRPVRTRVLELIESGFADFLASDAHRPDWRPTGIGRARAEIEQRFGAQLARALTVENPAAVLADRPLAAGGAEARA